MKKTLSLMLCLLLLVCVLLTGCQKSDKQPSADAIVGTWKADLDLSEFIDSVLASQDASMASYFDFHDLSLTFTMTFNKDGTYAMTGDKAQTESILETLLRQMTSGMEAYLSDVLEGSGIEISVEEYLGEIGVNMEDLLAELFTEDFTDELLESLEQTGYYKAENGKLYTSPSPINTATATYETYSLRGDTLTLTAGNDNTAASEVSQFLYPMVFTRVK